ncbi:pilus assembly protein [Rivibacter subsaxonicus]|uniref:Type IV pilus assembly protein PilY1 n=1 Tax=Rivibacter subsaxonicus TaxID=457575 RepID=A0A4Q7VVK5_9BURK|nr:PilC/PilY family type IV pilus protein [Rivibacter subsaxonicus]RZU00525.1 type IV pilus assembly protein PilY1 [Rivibacter subsaxonicus]
MNKKTTQPIARLRRWLLPMLLLAAAGAHAASTDIAAAPLVTSSPSTVLPNLMFVLDDSGSMDWDYMPDYVNEGFCRASGAVSGTTNGNFNRACCQNASNNNSGSNSCWRGAAPFGEWRGHAPFLSSSFNGLYYNPAVTYRPPLKADLSSWPAQNSANTVAWTLVKNDAYNIQNTNSINLLTQFPDTEWCTSSAYTDCLRNGNYVLPGTVNGKAYTTFRAVTATGSGNIAIGQPDAATTEARSFGPHYYLINTAEWCNSPKLRDCQATSGGSYTYPAPVRWCNSDANSRAITPTTGSCQAIRTATYSHARYPTKFSSPGTAGTPGTPAVAATMSFTFALNGCTSGTNGRRVGFSQAVVNGVDLLGGTATSTERTADNLAEALRDGINANTATTGYSATNPSDGQLVITAPISAGNLRTGIALTRSSASHASCTYTTTPPTPLFDGYTSATTGTPATGGSFPGSFTRVDIVPGTTSYPKAAGRSDCAGTTCTYAEEMTNFANWWTYYHSRMQSMKSSAGLAFATVSDQYRLGYMSINNSTGSDFLNLGTYTGTQKSDWFSKLVAAEPRNSTPLRQALSTVGRLYGGALNGSSLNGSTVRDPMQYSCQQNFTILSTDGYWNGAGGTQLDGTTAIGNQDGSLSRPLLDGTNTSDTLADVAAYYYNTDLRTSNCTSGSGTDLCQNNVPTGGDDVAQHQHMTTFTLGLGISGYMQFQPDYRTAGSGDFFNIKSAHDADAANGICTWQASGTCNWSVPASDSQTNIDDLWHAAVNGRGSYFSASDPIGLYTGLSSALAAIDSQKGSAAAATTSNPNISAGDNFVFLSSYETVEWTGDVRGQTLDPRTGQILTTGSDWSARDRLDANGSRTIYTFDAGSATGLKSFAWTALTAAEQAYFETAHMTTSGALSQFCLVGPTCLSSTSQADAAGAKLVSFLRGNRSDEGSSADVSKYFRSRVHLLGDIVHSEAIYVKKPLLNYADAGYAAHQTAMATRQAMVYVGANDGMLHALNAVTGDEMWAFVPSAVLPNLYKLADKNYAAKHQYYVDSSPVAGDVKIGGVWRTLLVGGLGAGGRAYYALDVTDPANPKALWQFSDANLGLTFGKPEIAKLKDGTWVVLVASGYNNNVGGGDGRGRLFVLNAADGTVIRSIDTGVGTVATPSGMAQIRAWVDNGFIDNTALRVYGGDNLGNLWRFDINGDIGAAGYDAQRLATLRGDSLNAQPITARPELAQIAGTAMIYIGTGRYLGATDLTDGSQQTIYAIKDSLGTVDHGDPRLNAAFVEQVLSADTTCPTGAPSCRPGQTVRTGTANPVNLATNAGWYVDLPISRERATNDPLLVLGTLVVTSNIPNATVCTAGGSSYINYFDYRTGGPIASGVVSEYIGNSLANGTSIVYTEDGKPVGNTSKGDATTFNDGVQTRSSTGATRRISWRELATEQ